MQSKNGVFIMDDKTILREFAVTGIEEVRHNIGLLMVDAKNTKANGKYFAYKKTYIMLSSLLTDWREKI